jgi:predicted dehydrogenase
MIESSSRRQFLRSGGAAAASVTSLGTTYAHAETADRPTIRISPEQNYVDLSQLHGITEAEEHAPGPFLSPDERVGFAIVGLGRLSLNQILPAFGSSKYCKPVALVSGDRGKALKVGAQYGISQSNITDYANYERLLRMPEVEVIYIVLPNSMHKEFVVRGAKISKNILCEKPMATNATDCQAMIAACRQADVKLMIAYRQQYEPMNRKIEKMVREGKIGKLNSIITTNSQNSGEPSQWRLKRNLSGGGCLPDVGIYCLNAARFLSGEEPIAVQATINQSKGDPRFTEVESHCSFILHFRSGLVATCVSAYDVHRSAVLRLEGSQAWVEMSPAYGYHGSRLKYSMLTGESDDKADTTFELTIPETDQFALEMDHFAVCVRNNTAPHTGGEEGLQDQLIIDAIYKSAASGETIRLSPPSSPTRDSTLAENI